MAQSTVLILNGPNLNLLGTREPHIYGRETLADVEQACRARAAALGLAIDFRQSNSEGELIDWVQQTRTKAAGIIINAGGYSHTSVALMDALIAVDLPVMEVHISNIHRRDAFRHLSYISKVAKGVIMGVGGLGYELALEALARHFAQASQSPDNPYRP
ncbi:MAG TPA: type II 3-dehydroquinate dehydratase [Stellaceae bacterium]|nr:type II 3-dehydroquinate dehydratase [Stellaceae bacterium]